jgi:superfamily II DNA or RNA helicase
MNEIRRDLAGIGLQRSYSTSSASMLEDFLIPALEASSRYDRASGYFSSALYAIISAALADFSERGGKIRLLCSPHLSEIDALAVAALRAGPVPTSLEIAAQSLRELRHGSDLQNLTIRCLSALIGAGVLELKFVTPLHGTGLFHNKTGLLHDDAGGSIAFTGSANETAAAWSGLQNHETVDVFRSWVPDDRLRVLDHERDFEELWNGYRPGWRVTEAMDAHEIVIAEQPSEPLSEVLAHLRERFEHKTAASDPLTLRQYQRDVVDAWESRGYKGIVSFATGGGKTRVGLEAIRRWTGNGRPALVLVPTQLLHDQWRSEIRTALPDANILLAGAGHSRATWRGLLGSFSNSSGEGVRVILATYDTARSPDFQRRLETGDHLIVVADEVHNFGAPERAGALRGMESGGRLGLSATPERYGDPAGTEEIYRYFGDVLQPTFGISEALDAGVLVPYRYDIYETHFTEDEAKQWSSFSHRISVALARNEGAITDEIRMLLIRRARVLKRASGKAEVAREIVEREYNDGDRWLVYCSDVEHLESVKRELAELALPMFEYHSQNSESHEAILDYFETRGGLLLAIKCLDEGVDIPLINGAIILASSTNPREYIQRRGRVLRKSPGKYSATLFDVMVVDEAGTALTPSEVTRGIEFAEHALNAAPLLYLETQSARLAANFPDSRQVEFEDAEVGLNTDAA